MRDDSPSRTALGVATSRAAHQILDRPVVFCDPVAVPLLGPQTAQRIRDAERQLNGRYARYLRAFLVARSVLAEEALAQAVARGVRQYVILGAGLDTFAHRNPHAALGLRIFEVDHPATQQWKRGMIDRSELPAPTSLTYVPVDFERQLLAEQLTAGGLRADEPTFFTWLGVTVYLTQAAITETLRFVAHRAVGHGGIAFDYLTPPPRFNLLSRWGVKLLMRRVAAVGEPWRTFLEPQALHAQLQRLGFTSIRDFSGADMNARFFEPAGSPLRVGGLGRVLVAGV